MATLSPDQRNYYYLLESERTGIHKPILAALYQIHSSPSLSDGQTGLGISPAKPDALLEGVPIWRGLDTKEAAIASLLPDDKVTAASEDESVLDVPLKQFVQQLSAKYRGYPKAREALVRMIQLWRQLRTREEAIASLQTNTSPQESLSVIDSALIAFVQRLRDSYQGRGSQRNALTEAFRLWRKLDSRAATLFALGIAPELLDRIGRPFMITSWSRSPSINSAVGGTSDSRHLIGDAIDFVCEGLTGNQLYWTLDPWWPGGLARFINFPNLCHIDARSYRARWLN
jgi:hypothetical protein